MASTTNNIVGKFQYHVPNILADPVQKQSIL